uniref:Uncharacterized protein n=1 Tax=Arundo donax TaxID=35708 RepID=A0A0A9CVR1_ARUDO
MSAYCCRSATNRRRSARISWWTARAPQQRDAAAARPWPSAHALRSLSPRSLALRSRSRLPPLAGSPSCKGGRPQAGVPEPRWGHPLRSAVPAAPPLAGVSPRPADLGWEPEPHGGHPRAGMSEPRRGHPRATSSQPRRPRWSQPAPPPRPIAASRMPTRRPTATSPGTT